MAKAEELVVITKTYDLILWSGQHTSRFPREHRFVLGERIERNLYGLLETLIQAPKAAASPSCPPLAKSAGLRKVRIPTGSRPRPQPAVAKDAGESDSIA